MQLTETIKLDIGNKEFLMLNTAMKEYIDAVNATVRLAISGISIAKFTSKDIDCALSSSIKNQVIRDAQSIVKKHYKGCRAAVKKNSRLIKNDKNPTAKAPSLPVLKKPVLFINNQNFRFRNGYIEFPLIVNGKSKRLSFKCSVTIRQQKIFDSHKLGTLRIVMKNTSIFAQVPYEKEECTAYGDGIMGVDLGIKCPAVSYITEGSVKFYGNGRKNKYIRRHYAYLRKKMQSSKHPEAVKHVNSKEQRIMKDIDHKLSRQIVNEAASHKVSVIRLESLNNIRNSTRKSRKNNHSIQTWSFYRLAGYIEYKAKLAGITVEYVKPAYTSQRCPKCGSIHHANDRNYVCACGYHAHRDIVGAMNICASTERVGDSNIRHAA